MKYINFLIFFFLLTTSNKVFALKEYNICVIKNIKDQNLGDRNASRGIANALKRKIDGPGTIVNISEYSVDQINEIEAQIANDEHSIIISSGNYGIELFQSISIQKNDLMIWTGHQFFTNLPSILNKENFLVILPIYVINNEIRKEFNNKKAKLIEAEGIPNNVTEELLLKEYQKYPVFDEHKKSLLVFVGGNAPDEYGNLKEMTASDAFYMGKAAAKIADQKDLFIFATNGPRTTSEQFYQFKKGLADSGLAPDKYKIFDYHSGEKVYYAMLYKAGKKSNEVLVSGESSSTVRDMVEQTNKPVHVYLVESMNQSHINQSLFEQKQGHINKVHSTNIVMSSYKYEPIQQVTQFVVERILEELHKEKKWE